jgi:fibronectin-binding autotransporter adhesin
MQSIQPSPRIAAALVAALLSVQSATAAVTTWNNAAGGNWSLGSNWDTLAAPGTADDTRFMNLGAGTPTTMDLSRTVNSLVFGQNNQALHTTTISPGQTLTVSRTGAGDVLYVGTAVASGSATLTPVTITGAGTLTLSGTGDMLVRQVDGTAGAHMATLDLSGLDTFNATIGRLLVGQSVNSAAINRPSGTLIMARTNHITLSGASPQVMLQDAGLNANGSTASVLTFGQETELFGDVMRLGGQKGNANLNFNGAFSSPSLKIRNADGVSRTSIIDFGYNNDASSGNNTVVVANFGGGIVDLSANLVNLAQGNRGPSLGTCISTLTIGAGTFDVNTLEIGYGNANGVSGVTTATFNVNNNGLLSTGAVVVVNTTLRLARTNNPSGGTVTGTLNLNGGTVVASNIVAGGGVGNINVNSGSKLVVTGTAGSLAAPIRTFSISDATLNIPAINGGAVVAVSNLTAGGSQNVINISSVPPIAAYPVTFTLINYQAGAGGNFVLGSLPPASPSYSGTLVDAGNGVVQLQLTAGPVVDLSLRWTGATDGTWNSFQQNWLYQGNPATFFVGAAALFNDNTSQSDVFLAEALSPGSITISNNTLPYTFTGSGNIAGASSLTKRGSSTVTIANEGVNNIGTVAILAGTLQLGAGGVDGSISALSISNNSSFIVNRSGSLTLSSAISGSGTLTKSGNGTLILSGASSYTGATALSGGALRIDGTSSGTGAVTTSAGTILGGSGTVSGAVNVAGQLNPGPVAGVGIFKAHGGLTLSSGSTLTFDLSAADYSNPAANDSVEVLGNLAANNNVISVNIAGTPVQGASYLLLTYSGTLSGSFNPTVEGTHFAANIDTSNPGLVYLNINGGTGSDLKWNSVSDNTWDSATANWLNLNDSQPSVFFSGDSALLDDTAGVVTDIIIPTGLTVSPSVVTNNSTNNNFSISGPGRIGGSASLVKSGPSTLILAAPNNFTGTVDIEEGTLQTASATALGAVAGGTTVHDGATLNLNGSSLGGEVVTASGAGVSGQGAIVNNGGAQNQAFRQVILAGDTTFGGTGLWGINNGGGAASLSTGGNPFNLTKVGPNQVNLAQSTVDAALADIDIQQGTLEFSGLTSSMGDPARTNFVQAGATLAFANGTVTWNKRFVLYGNGTTTTVNNGTGANEEIAGPVELHGDCVFNAGGTLLTISGLISGDGGLIKNGGSPMVLTNVNTYTGDTRISTAALRLNGNGGIPNSSNITINAGATLTVTGRVDTAFTLLNGQTLKGNGTINGKLTANANSIIAPGLDAIGALTISNAVTLSGTSIMELDEANLTNDVLRSSSTITYGGTLNLVNLGGPLTAGSSFKLFNASSYLGSFSGINPPTPGPGQTWDTSTLGTLGTLKVAAAASPRFGSIILSGPNLVLSGSNGVAGGTYYVLASTNLALAMSNWTRIATNSFDGSGNFNFTNGWSPSVRERFYQLQLP